MNRNKRVYIKSAVIVGILLLIIFTVFRYNQVNQEYPKQQVETQTIEKSFSAYGCTVTFSNPQMYLIKDFMREYNLSDEDLKDLRYDSESENYLITVVLNVKSKTAEDMALDKIMEQCSIQSDGFSNFYSIELVDVVSTIPEVKNDTDKSLTIPFSIPKSLFSSKDWEQIEEREFEIALGCYPVKYVVPTDGI